MELLKKEIKMATKKKPQKTVKKKQTLATKQKTKGKSVRKVPMIETKPPQKARTIPVVAEKESKEKKTTTPLSAEARKYKLFFWGLTAFLYMVFFGLLFLNTHYDIFFDEKNPISRFEGRKAKTLTSSKSDDIKHLNAKGEFIKNEPLKNRKNHKQKMGQTTPTQTSCQQPVKRKIAYNATQYVPYTQKGEAKISGSVCPIMDDGKKKCFANVPVYINPVTDYSDEWYARGWAGTEFLEAADKRVLPFNKHVLTDEKGNYTFEGLPAGSYYVVTQIQETGCKYKRYGAKVSMKKWVSPTLEQVFPKKK